MAKKLYIFGIGGTGARVIKALTMLLASGCKLAKDFDTVVPILIDPDTANGDLNRTKDILRLYQEIRNQVKEPDGFFRQEIKTINELANNSSDISPEYFQFKLDGTDNSTFEQYIGFDSLSEDFLHSKDDKNFIRLLYSTQNLKSELKVGFKGNPNMGAIVLNQFINSEDFKKFGQTFNSEDAIFTVNSIFGGTGAAGFPLLLKNFRGNENLPRHAQIKNAPIGGITYLPYYTLNKKDEINAESFEEKAKIALDYYNRTIIDQKRINALYFIGNKGSTNVEEYAVGGPEQKNKAHFLELAGALAVFDFCENINAYSCSNGQAIIDTQIKEFGIERDSDSISFDDLNISNSEQIAFPLSKFKLYTDYLNKGLGKAMNVSRWTKSNIKLVGESQNSVLNESYFNSDRYKNQINKFNNHFDDWIDEMAKNKPAFNPFNDTNWDTALELVKNRKPKRKGVFPYFEKSFMTLDTENCNLISQIEIRTTKEQGHTALIKLFGQTTERVLKKHRLFK